MSTPSAAVASPCVGVCALDAAGQLCVGCGRTLDEITAWSRASDAWRAQCVARLAGWEREASAAPPASPDMKAQPEH